MSSNIGLSFKSWRWIERWDRDSWLSGSLEWAIGCQMVHIRLGGIGYGQNGGSKCGSSEEEFRCSYDVICYAGCIINDSEQCTLKCSARTRRVPKAS